MKTRTYFSNCTTWNLVKLLDASEAPFTEEWRCAFCGTRHKTSDNKSGWMYCPVCGYKISTSKISNPIDRIYNLFLSKHIHVERIVVDWSSGPGESYIYICSIYKQNHLEHSLIGAALEPVLFHIPQGLPTNTEFKVIYRGDIPKEEDGVKRFVFLNPMAYPRWEKEVDMFKGALHGTQISRPQYRYLHTTASRTPTRKEKTT